MKVPAEKKYFAVLLIALLALFLAYAALPLLGGIFGAMLFYVLFKPLYVSLAAKTGRKTISAFLVMLLSLVLILLPLLYVFFIGMGEAGNVLQDASDIEAALAPFTSRLDTSWDGMVELVRSNIQVIAQLMTNLLVFTVNSTIGITLNLVVLYLILYYALTENESARKTVKAVIPFSDRNAERLMAGFSGIVRTTVIGNGIVAIIIGVLLALGLFALGVGDLLFWAVAGTVMAFIPIVGIQIIWIPAGIYYAATGNYNAGIAIVVWGAFLSYVLDGVVRQSVQKKVGNLHPLYSLVGMLIGITYFGILGIIIGPLILALFVVMARMFREEYLPGW